MSSTPSFKIVWPKQDLSHGPEMTYMNGRVFFDTNILVYANDGSEPAKKGVASALIRNALKARTAVISVQVLGEFWVTVTQKIKKPLPKPIAEKEVALFELMEIVDLDFQLFLSAIRIQKMNLLSYWDSLILAAADRADCTVLYSEDLNPGQKIRNIEIVNPFR